MVYKKIIATFVLVLTLFAPAYAQFSIQPAESGTSWFLYTMDPGSTISSDALATNAYPETREFSVHVVDATVDKKTEGFLPQGIEQENAILREWIQLPRNHLRIPGKTGVKIPFTIRAPVTATPGEYIGALMIQETTPSTRGGQISVATSVGARVYITVKPGDGSLPVAQRAYQSGNTESIFTKSENSSSLNGFNLVSDTESLEISDDEKISGSIPAAASNEEYQWVFNVLLIVIIAMAGLLIWRKRYK